MGIRFNKRIKIAKGVSLNLNKKSVGLSVGGKGAKFTVNSKGRRTSSVGLPGTGLYYTHSSGGKKAGKRKTKASNAYYVAEKKPMKTGTVQMIITILFGWFGIHWFISGRIGMGFLYMFTGGLFGIGWIVDSIKQIIAFVNRDKIEKDKQEKKIRLLEWQNELLDNRTPELIMNESQLATQTNERVQNDLRIIQDSIKLVQSTTNAEVFFSRFQMIEEKAKDLVVFEKYIDFTGAKPSAAINEIKEDKQKCIKEFLERAFYQVSVKADGLKTEKGRANHYKRFYESIKDYYEEMSAENIEFIEEKCKKYI